MSPKEPLCDHYQPRSHGNGVQWCATCGNWIRPTRDNVVAPESPPRFVVFQVYDGANFVLEAKTPPETRSFGVRADAIIAVDAWMPSPASNFARSDARAVIVLYTGERYYCYERFDEAVGMLNKGL